MVMTPVEPPTIESEKGIGKRALGSAPGQDPGQSDFFVCRRQGVHSSIQAQVNPPESHLRSCARITTLLPTLIGKHKDFMRFFCRLPQRNLKKDKPSRADGVRHFGQAKAQIGQDFQHPAFVEGWSLEFNITSPGRPDTHPAAQNQGAMTIIRQQGRGPLGLQLPHPPGDGQGIPPVQGWPGWGSARPDGAPGRLLPGPVRGAIRLGGGRHVDSHPENHGFQPSPLGAGRGQHPGHLPALPEDVVDPLDARPAGLSPCPVPGLQRIQQIQHRQGRAGPPGRAPHCSASRSSRTRPLQWKLPGRVCHGRPCWPWKLDPPRARQARLPGSPESRRNSSYWDCGASFTRT